MKRIIYQKETSIETSYDKKKKKKESTLDRSITVYEITGEEVKNESLKEEGAADAMLVALNPSSSFRKV